MNTSSISESSQMSTSFVTVSSQMTTNFTNVNPQITTDSISSITMNSQMSTSSITDSLLMSTGPVSENSQMNTSSVMNESQIKVHPETKSEQINESEQKGTHLEIKNFEIESDKEAYFLEKFSDIKNLSPKFRALLHETTKNLTKDQIDEFARVLSPEKSFKLRKCLISLVASCAIEAAAVKDKIKEGVKEEKRTQKKLEKEISKILTSVPKEFRSYFIESLKFCAKIQARALQASKTVWNNIKEKLNTISISIGVVHIVGPLATGSFVMAAGYSLFGGGLLLMGGIALIIYVHQELKMAERPRLIV